ncbi:MAG: small multi-drug export protein [Dehalococcoidales bacterium]|nr:small multi-drug export protein [Dehalococcoidales bacterium]
MELSEIGQVIGLAALPIAELRGAIPLALSHFDFTWYYAFLFAFIGNLIPVFVILLGFQPVTRLISRVEIGKRFLDWLFLHVRKRGRRTEKYERIGLALFVAIPLPITGAWTGSILAALRGYSFKYAFTSIVIGVIIAGIVVTSAWILGWNIFWLATS